MIKQYLKFNSIASITALQFICELISQMINNIWFVNYLHSGTLYDQHNQFFIFKQALLKIASTYFLQSNDYKMYK